MRSHAEIRTLAGSRSAQAAVDISRVEAPYGDCLAERIDSCVFLREAIEVLRHPREGSTAFADCDEVMGEIEQHREIGAMIVEPRAGRVMRDGGSKQRIVRDDVAVVGARNASSPTQDRTVAPTVIAHRDHARPQSNSKTQANPPGRPDHQPRLPLSIPGT